MDGFCIRFDVSALQHKRANEQHTLVYIFSNSEVNGMLILTVTYSEHRRKTNPDTTRRPIRDKLGVDHCTYAVLDYREDISGCAGQVTDLFS